MEYSSGAILRMTGDGIWKGQDKTNGKLMKGMNIMQLTLGYSKLNLTTALIATGAAGVAFGNGVWYDRYSTRKISQPGSVYGGQPTTVNAVPRLAGIVVQDEAIMTGQPIYNDVLLAHNKGRIAVRGYVQYKTAFDSAGDAVDYSDVDDTMNMFVDNDTGFPVVAAGNISDPVPASSATSGKATIEFVNPTAAPVTIEDGTYTYDDGTRVWNIVVATDIVLAAGARSGPMQITAAVAGVSNLPIGAITVTGLAAGAVTNVWSVTQGVAAVTASSGSLKPTLTGCTYIGPIVLLNPEDEAWIVDLDI